MMRSHLRITFVSQDKAARFRICINVSLYHSWLVISRAACFSSGVIVGQDLLRFSMTAEAVRDALSALFICVPLPFGFLRDDLLRSLFPTLAYQCICMYIMQIQMTTFLNDTTLTHIGIEMVSDLSMMQASIF